mmetsp:Transcript_26653/g.88456  ORF Transcript_26653/g.88456 Transcript_26653/m.88456 type:complete len:284 (-) Transcript_26653:3247-4098(-)
MARRFKRRPNLSRGKSRKDDKDTNRSLGSNLLDNAIESVAFEPAVSFKAFKSLCSHSGWGGSLNWFPDHPWARKMSPMCEALLASCRTVAKSEIQSELKPVISKHCSTALMASSSIGSAIGSWCATCWGAIPPRSPTSPLLLAWLCGASLALWNGFKPPTRTETVPNDDASYSEDSRAERPSLEVSKLGKYLSARGCDHSRTWTSCSMYSKEESEALRRMQFFGQPPFRTMLSPCPGFETMTHATSSVGSPKTAIKPSLPPAETSMASFLPASSTCTTSASML